MKKEWILLTILFLSMHSFADDCCNQYPTRVHLCNNTCMPASYFLSIGYGNIVLLSSPPFLFGGDSVEWLILPKQYNTCPNGTLRVDYIFGGRYMCSFFTTVECVSPETNSFKIVSAYSSCNRHLPCSIDMYPDAVEFKVN